MERGEIEMSFLGGPSPPSSSSEERSGRNGLASRLRKFFLGQPTGNETGTNGWRKCSRLKFPIVLNVVLFIIIIIILVLAIVLPNITKQPSSDPVLPECCPYNWTGYRNKCYYFSEEEGDWNSSNVFCLSNNASLARIEEDEESYFKRHDTKRSYWIGLQPGMGETRKWLNGDTAKMKVIGEGECAYWKAQDASTTASRCTSVHHWICSTGTTVKSKNHDEI